jgi:hypothetical protein
VRESGNSGDFRRPEIYIYLSLCIALDTERHGERLFTSTRFICLDLYPCQYRYLESDWVSGRERQMARERESERVRETDGEMARCYTTLHDGVMVMSLI